MKHKLSTLLFAFTMLVTHLTSNGQTTEAPPVAVKSGSILFRYVPGTDESIQSMRLAGSMNGWSQTDPASVMTKGPDGSYSLRVDLKPGRYYFKFVVDGKWARDMKSFAGRMEPRQAFFDGSGINSAGLDVAENGVPAGDLAGPGTVAAQPAFGRDVSGLTVRSEVGKAVLSWSLKDATGVSRIEVLARYHFESLYDPSHTVLASLPPSARSAEVAIEPLADVTLKVRTVSNANVPGAGVSSRTRIRHARVVADEFEGRKLFVRLPEGYETAKTPFPVVYMHDGQNLFSTASGSEGEWKVDEVLDRLEREGKVERMVVVGIFASGDRAFEYLPFTIPGFLDAKESFVGRGQSYASWIAKRVVPYVESKYKVSHDRRDRAVMGSSFGGVLAMWSILHQPDVYSFGGVISPAPVPGLIGDVTGVTKGDTRIWLDSGEFEDGFDPTYVDQQRTIAAALLRKGYVYGRDFVYYEVPDVRDHRESIVAERIEYPFIFFKGKHPAKLASLSVHASRSASKLWPGAGFINPIANFSNGLRYSLLGAAKYRIEGRSRASVSPSGIVAFNGEPSATVTVRYGGTDQSVTIASDPSGAEGGTVSAGTLTRHPAVESRHVAPRNVDVWLPPGYAENPAARYPVLYMHDGQNLFDKKLSYAGEWEIDENMQRLMQSGEARPAIVVGVWNTRLRTAEYMPAKAVATGGEAAIEVAGLTMGVPPQSDGYLKFLVEELKPMIDRTYRTKPDRENTFVMGSSMGGLISLYAICEYPEVFAGAGCVSTHWPAGGGIVVDYLRSAAPDPKTHRIYFDFGTAGLDAQYEPFQVRADEVMRQAGFVENTNWLTRKFPGDDHNEPSWSRRAGIPLRFLLGN